MKIEEITRITVIFPNRKKMKEIGFWNLNRPAQFRLKQAIEECLATGKEQFFDDEALFFYHIRPQFPLIPSAMEEPRNKGLLKVSIVMYSKVRMLGVRKELEDRFPRRRFEALNQ